MSLPRCTRRLTVGDALFGLGGPNGKRHYVLLPGGRVYLGHATGSPFDLPAKALKASDHGVPGGENMMAHDDGTVCYFTTREAAHLVGLPGDYGFPRSWAESMRRPGNAAPRSTRRGRRKLAGKSRGRRSPAPASVKAPGGVRFGPRCGQEDDSRPKGLVPAYQKGLMDAART